MESNKIVSINWREMVKTDDITLSGTASYGKIVCQPLERSYGITIGNSLRRVLLSSLYGAAIVSVMFDKVMHEFSIIDGVLEDVSEIILNLKQVRFKMFTEESMEVFIDVSGEGEVTAADIVSADGNCEVLNHDLHIATLTGDGAFKITMKVKVGKGYSSSEANYDKNAPIGVIPIDSVFSPVKRVTYQVSDARVGQKTDFDKLTLEVWTDGSVSPADAVAYSAKIIKEQMSMFINFDELAVEPEQKEELEDVPKKQFNENLYKNVSELELSVRSANCLRNADIYLIYQLVCKTEAEMLQTKNFGRKSLNEIKDVLHDMGLSLGMDLDGFELVDEEAEEVE